MTAPLPRPAASRPAASRPAAFLRPRPQDSPSLRLIGFHHAGGSAAVYYPLLRHLPADWDVLLHDLPGRGRRIAEKQHDDMRDVVACAVSDVLPWTEDVPCALFGHSMGAIVAAESARALESLGRFPVWTGVSGRIAPDGRLPGRAPLHTLDDARLLEAMVELGGMPDGVAEAPRFLEHFLRTVRTDLRAVHSYRPAADRTPLLSPLTFIGGNRDPWAPAAETHLWSRETRSRFAQRFHPGGHFYFLGPGFEALAHDLTRQVTACREAATSQSA
ncbi:alpha/beta fold hydrolase [Streptomyces sp. DSM 42041]|uniref:Alpha/beta fold hydrolase n=1 Tax=Streptomyces hazeniae TaxID=3075538 RepID=A0ABU2NNB2_9ACTN|nr:alpha/beta fold hydrolase [Streptomyces sp. DSM 42041]MDT0378448.1 alpha/beta fold hydrolase [Streptomyces sp. DSM 42041]